MLRRLLKEVRNDDRERTSKGFLCKKGNGAKHVIGGIQIPYSFATVGKLHSPTSVETDQTEQSMRRALLYEEDSSFSCTSNERKPYSRDDGGIARFQELIREGTALKPVCQAIILVDDPAT